MPTEACSAIAQVAGDADRDDRAADAQARTARSRRSSGSSRLREAAEQHREEDRRRREQQQPGDQRGARLGVQHAPAITLEVEDVAEPGAVHVGAAQQQQRERRRGQRRPAADHQPLHRPQPGARAASTPPGTTVDADQQREADVGDVARDRRRASPAAPLPACACRRHGGGLRRRADGEGEGARRPGGCRPRPPARPRCTCRRAARSAARRSRCPAPARGVVRGAALDLTRPAGSSTRSESSDSSTPSEKVRVTCGGRGAAPPSPRRGRSAPARRARTRAPRSPAAPRRAAEQHEPGGAGTVLAVTVIGGQPFGRYVAGSTRADTVMGADRSKCSRRESRRPIAGRPLRPISIRWSPPSRSASRPPAGTGSAGHVVHRAVRTGHRAG